MQGGGGVRKQKARRGSDTGLVVTSMTVEEKASRGIVNGVLVASVSGRAAEADIQAGDVILTVNGQAVNEDLEVYRLLETCEKCLAAVIVLRGDRSKNVALTID